MIYDSFIPALIGLAAAVSAMIAESAVDVESGTLVGAASLSVGAWFARHVIKAMSEIPKVAERWQEESKLRSRFYEKQLAALDDAKEHRKRELEIWEAIEEHQGGYEKVLSDIRDHMSREIH